MARGRIYRTEVEAARDRLVTAGRHPSIDAVRVELGNTGSKTTIHRILREIEEGRAEATSAPLDETALASSIQKLTRTLAETLRSEADSQIREHQEVSSLAVSEANARALEAEAFAHQQAVQAREATAQLTMRNARIDELELQLAEQVTDLAGRTMRIETLESVLAERERRVAAVSRECATLSARLDAAIGEAEALRSTVDMQRSEVEARHALVVADWQEKYDRVSAASAAATAVAEAQEKTLLDYQQRLDVLTADMAIVTARNESIIVAAAAVPALEARLTDASSMISTLQAALADERLLLKRLLDGQPAASSADRDTLGPRRPRKSTPRKIR